MGGGYHFGNAVKAHVTEVIVDIVTLMTGPGRGTEYELAVGKLKSSQHGDSLMPSIAGKCIKMGCALADLQSPSIPLLHLLSILKPYLDHLQSTKSISSSPKSRKPTTSQTMMSFKLLSLAVLAIGSLANPLDYTTDPCAVVRCGYGPCTVVDGKAVCPPKPTLTKLPRTIVPLPLPTFIEGILCGKNTCSKGQYCCNRSCGTCAPIGGDCTQQYCSPIEIQTLEECGSNVCVTGQFCCNRSCGICAPIGGACTQQVC